MVIDLSKARIGIDGETVCEHEVLAFTALELARLLCERLWSMYPGDQGLAELHRDVGLAGYHTCSAFSPALRGQCLKIAREEVSRRQDRDPDAVLRAILEATIAAVDAVESAQHVAASEHLEAAQFHASCAADILDLEMTRQPF